MNYPAGLASKVMSWISYFPEIIGMFTGLSSFVNPLIPPFAWFSSQLILTVLMTCVVIYLYTVLAFNFFRKFYMKDEDGQIEYKCHNMMTVSMPS